MRTQKGFTIIELIVVIAIIAILAAIVMINVTKYIKSANIAAVKADMESAQTVAMAQYADPAIGNCWNLCDNTDGRNVPPSSSPIYGQLYKIQNLIGPNNPEGVFYCNDSNEGDCSSPDQWSLEVDLSSKGDGSSGYWCVDSAGFKGPSDGGVSGNGQCLCHAP